MSIGKLKLSRILQDMIVQMENDDINIIPIKDEHLLTLLILPFHHNDPFDRLLIAKAQTEKLIVISDDNKFNLYNINILN